MHIVLQTILEVGSRCNLHRHGDETRGVERTRVQRQATQELVAFGRMGRFVGNAPDDDIGAVLIAQNHVGQLTLGILVSVGVGPCNGPIDGNLRPDENAHSLCLTHSIFVMGIMSKANEVTAQFLCP